MTAGKRYAGAEEVGQSLGFATDPAAVDEANAQFYGRIQYPWAPQAFERVSDADFWRRFLCQDIGSWDHSAVPRNPRIWVAGCGTNQALMTALKFPDAEVLGSDVSRESLDVSAAGAERLGVRNLRLERESINEVSYDEQFDYVICTGVIHHNADPARSLQKLASALKRSGVMELMVYNTFHRILTSAFQRAVRVLVGDLDQPDLAKELPVAKRIVRSFRKPNLMTGYLETMESRPDAAFADELLQPVEHSNTVESLDDMATSCGLDMLVSCVDQFSRARGTIDWNLDLQDPELNKIYSALPDTRRWQVTNLLSLEGSPLLWFYFQRADSEWPRKTERELCEEFLATRFVRANTERTTLRQNVEGAGAAMATRFPGSPRDANARKVHESLDERAPIKETIERLELNLSVWELNRLRIHLATSAFPFLVATS